ncbi:hypothetical protein CPB84DRAFT_1749214 [Gymnopilus junonius]|uniref:Uncharacterized protein n=1 Tax=Gymnopilus junonius TaxID=109634 RepID=A0A9P5NI56_GYMJU|nr:hypothetical protein CPB84DRAFT_1749214 [Gymnopilus junonius]
MSLKCSLIHTTHSQQLEEGNGPNIKLTVANASAQLIVRGFINFILKRQVFGTTWISCLDLNRPIEADKIRSTSQAVTFVSITEIYEFTTTSAISDFWLIMPKTGLNEAKQLGLSPPPAPCYETCPWVLGFISSISSQGLHVKWEVGAFDNSEDYEPPSLC